MRKALVFVCLGLLALPTCGDGGGIEVGARFSDVGDLATSAPVMMADIEVGEVVSIELDGTEALVTMALDPDASVPEGVVARVRRTSLLGERIVDLVMPEGLPADAPPLRDGAVIEETEVRPDLEDLVREGVDVLAPIAASEVATLVEEGAAGFGEQGAELRTLLGNFRLIVRAYAGRTEDLRAVIESMNQLNTTLAGRAEAHARSVVNTNRSLEMLREESDRLEVAIRSLARLAMGGRAILDEHADEINRFFAQMRVILGVLRSEQRSIALLLAYAPRHNRNTQLVDHATFNLVFQDFVICGFNDDPTDPARRCKGGS